jgi:hypothetical protein
MKRESCQSVVTQYRLLKACVTGVLAAVSLPWAAAAATVTLLGGVLTGNEFRFNAVGTPNSTWHVSWSGDLVTWQSLPDVTLNNSGAWMIRDWTVSGVSQRFYRLVENTSINPQVVGYGYYQKTVAVKGYALIANQLSVVPGNPPDDLVNMILPEMPDFTELYVFANGQWQNAITFYPQSGWFPEDATIDLGQGAMVFNPTTSPLTLNFIGEVPQGTWNPQIPAGGWMGGSTVPQSAALSVLGVPGNDFDTLYGWTGTQWGSISTYYGTDVGGNGWYPDQVITVGEAFFLDASQPLTWTIQFSL